MTDHGTFRTLEAASQSHGDDIAYAYRERLIKAGWLNADLTITEAGREEMDRLREALS